MLNIDTAVIAVSESSSEAVYNLSEWLDVPDSHRLIVAQVYLLVDKLRFIRGAGCWRCGQVEGGVPSLLEGHSTQ